MELHIAFSARQIGGAALGLALLGIAALGSAPVQAAFITGSMGLGGAFTASGGTDLSDATMLDLTSATGTSGGGDIGSTVGFNTPGTVNNSPFSFNPFAAVPNLLQIGGWQVDLATLSIVDQTTSILNLAGTGTISGNGFDLTPTQWSLSANATGSTYSMTVTAVPIPAAVWLFGSGLLGLVGIARKKA
jgi:hypothetical protein